MIHVFYNCGSFGSTIEYVLRNYTGAGSPIQPPILPDGSMHSFHKQCHVTDADDINTMLSLGDDSIVTLIYPFKQFGLDDIIKHCSQSPGWTLDRKILIYLPDLKAVEINLLFQYHKVCDGAVVRMGLDPIIGDNSHNITAWNTTYTHWSQMQPWELREWFSIFYPGYAQELINVQDTPRPDWLMISNIEILEQPKNSFTTILDYCGFDLRESVDEFADKWKQAQQYVVDEFHLLDRIVDSVVNHQVMSWEPLNIIAESIVQQRLRQKGFELQCDGLNNFPTDSTRLQNILVKQPC